MYLSSVGSSGGAFVFGAAKSPAILALQRALVALAQATKDAALAAGGIDGLMGKNTLAGVNRALTKYVGNAPPNMRTGRLTAQQVTANASTLTGYINNEAQRRVGAARPAPAAAPVTAQRPTSKSNPDVARLQRALIAIGQLARDAALNIVADGMVGPKTATAVNRAFPKYVVGAPTQYRTGRLTVANIAAAAPALAKAAEQEVARRRALPAAAAAAPKPAAVPAPSRVVVQRLQQGMRALADVTKDRALYIATDGIVGPGTTTAVNRALSKYVVEAPKQWRTGKLTVAAVKANTAALIPHVETAIARLRAAAKKKPPAAPPPAPKAPTVARPAREAVMQLQRSLSDLGDLLKDNSLKVNGDGVIGPKTAAAVNYVFTRYIDESEAPSQFRTGRLTLASIAGSVDALTGYVQQEVARAQADRDRAAADAERADQQEAARAQQEQEQRERVAQDSVPTTPTPDQSAPEQERYEEAPAPAPVPQYAPTQYAPQYAPPAPGVGPAVPATVAPPPPAEDYGPPSSGEEYAPVPAPDYGPPVPVPGGGETAADLAPAAQKPFPTMLVVGIGGGVVVLGLVAYLIWGGKDAVPAAVAATPGLSPQSRRPRPRPQRRPARVQRSRRSGMRKAA